MDYNAFDDHTIVESSVTLPEGDAVLGVRFRRGPGRTGSITLTVDGTDAGEGETALYMRMISSVGSSVGYDQGSPVSSRYQGAFRFSGTLHEVEIQLVARAAGDTAEADAKMQMSRQ